MTTDQPEKYGAKSWPSEAQEARKAYYEKLVRNIAQTRLEDFKENIIYALPETKIQKGQRLSDFLLRANSSRDFMKLALHTLAQKGFNVDLIPEGHFIEMKDSTVSIYSKGPQGEKVYWNNWKEVSFKEDAPVAAATTAAPATEPVASPAPAPAPASAEEAPAPAPASTKSAPKAPAAEPTAAETDTVEHPTTVGSIADDITVNFAEGITAGDPTTDAPEPAAAPAPAAPAPEPAAPEPETPETIWTTLFSELESEAAEHGAKLTVEDLKLKGGKKILVKENDLLLGTIFIRPYLLKKAEKINWTSGTCGITIKEEHHDEKWAAPFISSAHDHESFSTVEEALKELFHHEKHGEKENATSSAREDDRS